MFHFIIPRGKTTLGTVLCDLQHCSLPSELNRLLVGLLRFGVESRGELGRKEEVV
jgi:hypothetical protein